MTNALPHSIDAERGILGCCLDDPNLVPDLRENWFYDEACRIVTAGLIQMAADGNPIDVATICERLKTSGQLEQVGGVAFLASLPECGPSPANFPHWKAILEDKATLRSIADLAVSYHRKALEPEADAQALLTALETDALGIRRDGASSEKSIRDLVLDAIQELETAHQHAGQIRGIPTGFAELDRMTNGLCGGQLWVIAARPAVGKTSLAMNIAEHIAVDLRLPVGVFSLEMSAAELVLRLQCSRARVSPMAAGRGELAEADFVRLTEAAGKLARAPLCICDQAGSTVGQMSAKARQWKQKHGIRLIVVDYLGLLRGGGKFNSRYEEISRISADLKRLAKDLSVPVLCLAQLNRSSERENRPPFLSDLRDSGSIEQDADLVALLHKSEDDDRGGSRIDLIVAKQRSGPTGRIPLVFHGEWTRFLPAGKIAPEDVPSLVNCN
ncbi:MAG TPA: replicative DNA helicase [Candidatus Paceibacterota bacterium]|nr:replicative DNA helicase [Verrucomicrobiota bacterium]HRY51827.1 replicative DNA helicase [Candidatus Paceibacterota bacterium]